MVKAPGVRHAAVSEHAKALAEMTVSKRVEVVRELFDLGDKVIAARCST
jgi:hypothetical protein